MNAQHPAYSIEASYKVIGETPDVLIIEKEHWKPNFITPKEIEEKSKVSNLEDGGKYIDENGNPFFCVFAKYGVFGMENLTWRKLSTSNSSSFDLLPERKQNLSR